MKITVQLVVCDDDGHEEPATEVVILEKAYQRIEQVGLTLAEAKALWTGLQQRIVERQIASFLATRRHGQVCGQAPRTKGHHSLTFRTLFGTIRLNSLRLRQCACTPDETATFSPLTQLLSEHTAPELLFEETGKRRSHHSSLR
jgi:hypothetical protein